MPLGTPIALGFTAEIFAWHDGQVLKLFNQGISRSTVEYEANMTRIVHATGLRVPTVGEIVEIEGRFGLELERVDGISMLQAFTRKPWKFPFYARQLAELQADMHTRRVPELSPLGERLVCKIKRAEKLPENVRQAALKALEKLQEDDRLCHGDFHPGNILLTSRGPVIIDWIDASRGRPVLDVARSSLLFGGGNIPSSIPGAWILRILQGSFFFIYKRRYFQLNHIDKQVLESWIPVVAAGRLDENIYFDENRLLTIAQRLIK
jgi:tRNA A-37 threonylcarbamoyl transferase component Bud32